MTNYNVSIKLNGSPEEAKALAIREMEELDNSNENRTQQGYKKTASLHIQGLVYL